MIPPPMSTRAIVATAAAEWGTTRLLHATSAGRALLRSPAQAERARARARWGAILGAHASPDERAQWRRPPCAPPDGVPAWACAHAVRVLWRASRMGDAAAWRGGWDAVGHWGANAQTVADAWHVARGRATALGAALRWSLRNPGAAIPRALRRLSAAQLRSALRVAAWPETHGLDARALVALGELAAPVRAVALRGAHERARAERPAGYGGPAPVRRRHLDWRAVSDAQRAVRAAPREHRAAIAAAFAQTAWARRVDGAAIAHPSYPLVRRDEVREALWRGARPATIAAGLTAREAHAWLAAGAILDTPAWLCESCGLSSRPRSVEVARWLIAVERDPARREALYRERTVRGPAGDERTVRFVDRADEIEPCDLTHGARTSVERAFERAAERFGTAALDEWREDRRLLAHLPAWWRPIRCARVLRTAAELVAEGEELGHCVGGYVEAVRSKKSVIIAMNVCDRRSTVEVSGDGLTVRQHCGRHNAMPPELCVRAWEVIARRCGITSAHPLPLDAPGGEP